MIVGENARAEEMDVNPTKEKKLNNIRSSTAEELVRLTPAMTFSLEHALEFIATDECVEVTPKAVRLRKVVLDQPTRGRQRSRARDLRDAGEELRRPACRREVGMASGTVRNEGFDHMTVVVTDLDAARRFFGLLGFVERVAVVAQGEEIARYMGIEGWEADHVTLVLEDAPVHQEVQLLRFHHPAARPDEGAGTLTRLGFNHVLLPGGRPGRHARPPGGAWRQPRNEIMDFHERRLVFLDGPGVVVELAEWVSGSAGQGALDLAERPTPGGMAERTNAQLLKSCEVQASVGSNPTPSALCRSWRKTIRPSGGLRHAYALKSTPTVVDGVSVRSGARPVGQRYRRRTRGGGQWRRRTRRARRFCVPRCNCSARTAR